MESSLPAEVVAVPSRLDRRSLRTKVISVGIWTVVNHGGSQFLRLAGNLVLSRILFPEAFGLMALVAMYMQGIQMFSDVGLGVYLIQSSRAHDEDFADAVWAISIARGAVITLFGCLLAYPMSQFYNEPRLLPMLLVCAVGLLLGSCASTKLNVAQRELNQRPLVLFALVVQIVGLIVMIVLAWILHSVWGLVLGGLVSQMVHVFGSHFILPGRRNRWRWDAAVAKELSSFGKWIYFASIIGFLSSQADRLLLGKLVPLDNLGIYNMGQGVGLLCMAVAMNLGGNLMLPLGAQMKHGQDPALRAKIHKLRSSLLLALACLTLCLCLGAEPLFAYLYDSRYAECAWIASVIALGSWGMVLSSTSAPMLLGLGDASASTYNKIWRLVCVIGGGLIGYSLAKFVGFIIGSAIGNVLGHLINIYFLQKHGFSIWRQDLAWTAILAGLAGGGVLLSRTLCLLLGISSPASSLAVCTMAALCSTWAIVALLRDRRTNLVEAKA